MIKNVQRYNLIKHNIEKNEVFIEIINYVKYVIHSIISE